jgi:hypothetical protein
MSNLGFYSGRTSGQFDKATHRAVLTWRSSLGDVLPRGSFDPANVLWLPVPRFVVGATTLVAGSRAPTAGDEVASGPPRYQASLLHSSDRSPVDPVPSGYVLNIGSESLGSLDNAGLNSNQVLMAASIAARTLPPTSVTGSEGSRPVELNGSLMRKSPIRRTVVPAGAVLTDPVAGTTCVIVDSGGSWTPFATTVVGGSLGTVYIEPALQEGTAVIANPLDVAPSLSC